MRNSAIKLADQFIGLARQNPRQAHEIFRRAAATFAGLASDPQNAHATEKLTAIGLDFAGAAAQAPTTSDFTQLLQDTARAWNELGPEAAASLSTVAQDATAIQRQNFAQEVVDQIVSVQPRSFLNKDVTLGRVASVTFAPTQDQINAGILQNQTVAFWQGAKRESQAMTIDFGNVFKPNQFAAETVFISPPVVDARPYADIQFGADGNTQNTVRIDVGLGRRITVVGNYISVIIGMDPPRSTSIVTGTSPVLSIGASIGTFNAHSVAPVIRTVYIDEAPVNFVAPTLFPIPLRAVTMLPPLASSPTDTLTIGFTTINGIQIGQWESVYSPTTPFWTPYPVPADAYFISVKSLQGVPTGPNGRNGIRIPFQLSL